MSDCPLSLRYGSFSAEGAGNAGGITEGQTVYRVWGGDPGSPDTASSGPWGQSWTTVDPSTIKNYRNVAGLPNVNAGRFVSVGKVIDSAGISTRDVLPLDGNPGGLSEVQVSNPTSQIELHGVYGVNPPY